ncbi:hypothetical protein BU16DRAFT_592607 [Lophium mytilinum]|uniref:Uncharacterized protein n=1 Tax=Lophium mytilinum TaxID=390894 RepID=A0A6A6QL63_9PEZI|nr:hypothetical protein BU16DRAFT_592607 [Lophium mytilinum]
MAITQPILIASASSASSSASSSSGFSSDEDTDISQPQPDYYTTTSPTDHTYSSYLAAKEQHSHDSPPRRASLASIASRRHSASSYDSSVFSWLEKVVTSVLKGFYYWGILCVSWMVIKLLHERYGESMSWEHGIAGFDWRRLLADVRGIWGTAGAGDGLTEVQRTFLEWLPCERGQGGAWFYLQILVDVENSACRSVCGHLCVYRV